MAPVCRLIRADCGYVTRGDGGVPECLGAGDGEAGMEADAEGKAERGGVAVAGSDGGTDTGGRVARTSTTA
jgi:hypothetical protein